MQTTVALNRKNLTINALDCRNPSNLRSYDISNMCRNHTIINNRIEKITLLQKVTAWEIPAKKCILFESHFLMYCGVYSHMKLARAPIIHNNIELSIDDCKRVIATQTYILRNGESIPITLNQKAHFQYVEHGSTDWQTDNLYCNGADITYRGERHTQILLYVSGSILLTDVTLKQDDSKLVDTFSHALLPESCISGSACIAPEATYVKLGKQLKCNYKAVRTLDMQNLLLDNEKYLVSHEHKILIKIGSPVTLPDTCAVKDSYKTQYPQVTYIRDANMELSQIQGGDVDIDLEMRITTEYLQFYAENLNNQLNSLLTEKFCMSKISFPTGTDISPFNPGYLVRRRGGVLQEFQCESVRVTAIVNSAPLKECFNHDIPVFLNDELVLLDTEKGIISDIKKKKAISCDLTYPDYVWDTTHKYLLYADPVIRVEHHLHLKDYVMSPHDYHHEAIEKSLFYTKDEVTKYENLIHFHQVRNEVLDHFVANLCSGENSQCGYNSKFTNPIINWSNLLPQIPEVFPWQSYLYYFKLVGVLGGILFILKHINLFLKRWIFYYKRKRSPQQTTPIQLNLTEQVTQTTRPLDTTPPHPANVMQEPPATPQARRNPPSPHLLPLTHLEETEDAVNPCPSRTSLNQAPRTRNVRRVHFD